jgi:hypothetical protein
MQSARFCGGMRVGQAAVIAITEIVHISIAGQ